MRRGGLSGAQGHQEPPDAGEWEQSGQRELRDEEAREQRELQVLQDGEPSEEPGAEESEEEEACS